MSLQFACISKGHFLAGLSEYVVLLFYSLLEDMHKLAVERKGGPMLYELIEVNSYT